MKIEKLVLLRLKLETTMKIKTGLFVIFFLYANAATALSCASVPFDEQFQSAHEILHVEAIACEFPKSMVLKQPLAIGQCPGGKWKVRVKEVFKGEPGLDTKEIFVLTGQMQSWPYSLRPKGEYVLYLSESRGRI